MEEDGEETPRTPFWIQSTKNVRRAEVYRRRASSLFFNSGLLIILLLLFAVLSMVFIIPTVISFTSQIFRPNLVKKSWDSINLVLVLVALAFGFLSRNINNEQKSRFDRSRSDLSTGAPVASPSSSTPHQWYAFPEQPISGLRRHRSTSSYPDLRELAPPWNNRAEAPWRFSDDTHLNSHRVVNYDRYYFRREQDLDTKEVYVDTVVDLPKEDSYAPPPQPPIPEEESYSPSPLPPQPPAPEDESSSQPSQPPAPEHESYSPPPQLPSPQSLPPPPPPAPRPSAKKKPIRTYRNVAADDGERSSRSEINEVLLSETEPPVFQDSERKRETSKNRGKGERRRARSSEPRKLATPIDDPAPESQSPPQILPEFQDSGGVERKRTGANATKRFFTSFYQKKKKRQRQRSLDNFDNLLRHPQPPVNFQLPPPSPPPPPPPLPPPPHPSVLNNLFTSKKERRKKIASATPPPPPPPPPRTAARAPRPTITRVSPFVTEKPRVPVKMSFNGIDDSSSGGESPMNRIPPPPPMPPFKMPDWKFAVEGDYVRVQSTLSSGSISPDGDDAHSPSSAVATPLFCPSPDVDTKADTFIARFRAGLKLEKINSFNQNQGFRMSNLGPGQGPSQN